MTNGIHRNFSAVRPASTCHCTSPRSYSSHSSSANLQSHKATVQRSSSSTRASKGQVTSHRQTYGQRVATMARAVPTAQETTRTLRSTGPTIAEGRQMLLDSIALESFKMTGVSFKGRQDLVSKLHPDQAVMMMKEQDNSYDPQAIAVQTLSGQVLGYVPRGHTTRFPYDTTFGHVYSMGKANSVGLWGATVAVRPTLPPLTLDAIPANLAPHAVMERTLPPEDFQVIRAATCKRANNRCEISGGALTERPAVRELWRADPSAQTLQLRGFVALHPDIHTAADLEMQQDPKRLHAARLTLQAMNAWTAAEADEYVHHIQNVTSSRGSQEWKFDLQWLSDHDLSIPKHLQSLCHATHH